MALTDIGLCSRALIRIGANSISSFSDGSAEAEIAGALYDNTRDALLSSFPWNFASGQVALAQLEDAPLGDYAYAYQLPNDFLRALSAGSNGRGKGLEYRITGGALHTDSDNVLLSYIYRPDESEFPPYFDAVLIARLSAEFVIPVTENTERADVFAQLAEQAFTRAKQIDSQQDSPARLENFSLIDVRG